MNIFDQEEDEDSLYHCRIWSFDEYEIITFLFLEKICFHSHNLLF
jgi:hypothetical protein